MNDHFTESGSDFDVRIVFESGRGPQFKDVQVQAPKGAIATIEARDGIVRTISITLIQKKS
jgi:hypothetical protein